MRCMYQKEEKGGRGIERDIVRIKKMKYNKNRSRKEGRGMACKKERRVLLGKEVEVEVEAVVRVIMRESESLTYSEDVGNVRLFVHAKNLTKN